MQIKVISYLAIFTLYFLLLATDMSTQVVAQEPTFELPVQLIGFPVIILSVRLSNFAKKLAYSLNPNTYRSRSRRSLLDGPREFSSTAINIALAEKQIVNELGPTACVMEEPCRIHAARHSARGEQPDWEDILKNYKVQSTGMKQWYLLSVFLGDVIRDVALCKHLAKRLECGRHQKPFIRD